jgi:type IV secretory pathway TrbF-like protein
VHDLFDELTGHHRPDSDPPFTRACDRHVGRFVRLGARWVITTKGGTVLVALASGFLTWLSHHLTHWMDRF